MTTTDWIQAIGSIVNVIVIVVLVGVTWWYAKQTKKIAVATEDQAKATKEQADASVKMAEEMEQQRLDTVHPQLVLCQTYPSVRNAVVDFKQVLPSTEVNLHSSVQVHNFGVGLAQNISMELRLGDGWESRKPEPLPPLAPQFWTAMTLEELVVEMLTYYLSTNPPQDQRVPQKVTIQLSYHDLFGHGHLTRVELSGGGSDPRGEFFYKVTETAHCCLLTEE